jgi:hypothetical protein
MNETRVSYFTGLDLGQAQDFTAVAVLERTTGPDPAAPGRLVNQYAVRHLERFPLGAPFTQVFAELAKLFAKPPLSGSVLAVDQTAVGGPVVNLLRRTQPRASIRPMTITGGHNAAFVEGCWQVPKKELVSTLQVLLQFRRIKVPPSLPQAQILVQELLNFKAKIRTTSDDTLAEWREGTHDDLVFAVAIAAWIAERMGVGGKPPPLVLTPGFGGALPSLRSGW